MWHKKEKNTKNQVVKEKKIPAKSAASGGEKEKMTEIENIDFKKRYFKKQLKTLSKPILWNSVTLI